MATAAPFGALGREGAWFVRLGSIRHAGPRGHPTTNRAQALAPVRAPLPEYSSSTAVLSSTCVERIHASNASVAHRPRARLTAVRAYEPPRLDLALPLHVHEPDRLGDEVVAQELPGRARDLNLVRRPVRFHPARHVHRVAPQVVEETATPDHASHDRPGADADAQSHVVGGAVAEAGFRALAHLEREPCERLRVVRPLPGDPRRDHVAVADGLDLLDLVAVDELVEA